MSSFANDDNVDISNTTSDTNIKNDNNVSNTSSDANEDNSAIAEDHAFIREFVPEAGIIIILMLLLSLLSLPSLGILSLTKEFISVVIIRYHYHDHQSSS